MFDIETDDRERVGQVRKTADGSYEIEVHWEGCKGNDPNRCSGCIIAAFGYTLEKISNIGEELKFWNYKKK